MLPYLGFYQERIPRDGYCHRGFFYLRRRSPAFLKMPGFWLAASSQISR
jgi:hypothetical protein